MAKIYEALEQAQREWMREKVPLPVPANEDPQETPRESESKMHQEMALLYQHIDSLLAGSPKKVIQFVAAKEGEGTTTIVQEFARTSATILGKSVFLFEADVGNALPRSAGGAGGNNNGQDFPDPEPGEVDVPRDAPASTAVCLIPQTVCGIRKYFYSPQIDSFWENLRKQFDLVLIDSPSFETSPDGIAIARKVDGVVIVLEAEKTRWPIAERLIEQILLNGGNILGIVFNKRRHYIPEFIYRRI
jgi:Mrp family chromosome partitioning ATPase